MNSIFGIKNTEFIIGLKKKRTKLVRLATWGARMALVVLWESSMTGVVNAGN